MSSVKFTFVCIVVLMLLASTFGGLCTARDPYPDNIKIETTPPLAVGLNTVRVAYKSNWFTQPMKLILQPIGEVVITGDSEWSILAKKEVWNEFYSTFILPDNDTSGLNIELIRNDKYYRSDDIWFVTTGDTVEVYKAKPEPHGKYRANRPSVDSMQVLYEKERKRREQIKSGQAIIGEHYKETKIVPTEREKMAFREQKPCLNHTGEFITVDGIPYRRNYGEYKFHECEIIPDPEARLDSLIQYRKDNADKLTKHIVMDLRDPDDYDFVARLCPALKAMEREGYYEGVLTLWQVEMIIDRGIQSQPYPRYPGEPSPGQADRLKRQKQDNGEKKTESESDKADKDDNYLFEYYFEEPIDTVLHVPSENYKVIRPR